VKKKIKNQTKTIFTVLILIILGLLVLALNNFLASIFSGLVLAYVFYPMFNRISKKIKSDIVSASITLTFASIIVVVPFLLLFYILISQGLGLYASLQNINILELVKNQISDPEVLAYITNFVNGPSFQKTLAEITQASFSIMTKGIHSTIGYVANLILGIFVGLVVMFFALLDRGKMLKFLESFIPFSKKNRERLKKESEKVVKTVLYSQIPISIIQGAVGGVGFLIFGLGGAVLWGIVMAIFSFIPFIGASFFWIPASIYLYFAKGPMFGIGMFLYGLFIVSYVDNILRMKIMSSFGKIHPLTTLFGILIGVMQFGIIGLVIGPLFLALLLRVLHIMKEEKF